MHLKNYKPLGDKVLIKVTQNEKTASGIIMPDSSSDNIKTGRIVATGNGLYSNGGVLIPLEVKAGNSVMFQLGMGIQKVQLEGIDYYICREAELLLVLPDDELN